jgi:AcrR family transcriptional regulator
MEHGSRTCQDGDMTDERQRPGRRSDALTKARIVQAAVGLLNDGGVDMLTFRALAVHLSTGAGALYHHVANKSDLLAAAADEVMADVLSTVGDDDPSNGIRALMVGVFDAVTSHPWLGTQLVAAPWQPAVLRLFDRVGSELTTLGVPERAQFDAASVLVHHMLGVASQYDAGLRLTELNLGRQAFIESTISPLVEADSKGHPLLSRISQQITEHEDRGQFHAGVEIILAGIATL